MAGAIEPLRAEHRELKPHIERLRALADAIGELDAREADARIDDALEFLTRHLVPHARAEDRVLYPAVGRAMGAPQATATMQRDHIAVVNLIAELSSLRHASNGQITDGSKNDLRRILYGLYTLLETHFAKEEEIYLPLLDARLTSVEAAAMIAEMERAAADAKTLVG